MDQTLWPYGNCAEDLCHNLWVCYQGSSSQRILSGGVRGDGPKMMRRLTGFSIVRDEDDEKVMISPSAESKVDESDVVNFSKARHVLRDNAKISLMVIIHFRMLRRGYWRSRPTNCWKREPEPGPISTKDPRTGTPVEALQKNHP